MPATTGVVVSSIASAARPARGGTRRGRRRLLVHHLELEAGTEHRPSPSRVAARDIVVRVDTSPMAAVRSRDGRLVHRIAFLRAIDDHIGARSVALDPNVTVSDFGHTTHSSGSSKSVFPVCRRQVPFPMCLRSCLEVSTIAARDELRCGRRGRDEPSGRTVAAAEGTAEIRRRSAGCRPAGRDTEMFRDESVL